MKTYHWVWYALLILVFMMGFIIRVADLFDAPLDYHPTRQLRSALIARGMYYENLASATDWQRDMAYKQWQAQGLDEPQIMERLTAFSYRIFGSEQLWIARLWAILFWMVGGIFLFLITEEIADFAAGTFAVIFYMVWPYTAIASRAFQPEPLLIMTMLIALWAFIKWVNSEKWIWAVLAGLFCGMSIYIKSTAAFFLIPAVLSLLIQHFGLKKLVKNRQAWLIIVLAVLPYLLFLIYKEGILNAAGSVEFRLFPRRWFQPLFYLQWVLELDNAIDLIIIIAAVMGITLFTKKEYFMLLVGFFLGYIIYGFAFSYHITILDYYHLMLIIPVSIGVGIILGKIFNVSERHHTITRIIFTIGALVFIGFNVWEIRSSLSRNDYTQEIAKWEEAGNWIGHDGRVIGIFPDYGYRLAYFGWNHVSSWTTSNDIALRRLEGLPVNLEEEFENRIAEYDFFVVGNQAEYERQAFLKDYFETNYLKAQEIGDVLIYDLRAEAVE